MNTADDDDEVVPQLITLDEHLSEQIEARLKGSFEDKEVDAETAEDNSKKVPITILTGICSPGSNLNNSGYLGSGKTTLLNYILNEEHGKKIAVILNGVQFSLVLN